METNEKRINYQFTPAATKLMYYLDCNQFTLLTMMLNKSTLNENSFELSISYICKNLDITNEKAQKLINQLTVLKLINKKSGFKNRTKNTYSINYDTIEYFDKLDVKEIFILRDEKNLILKNIKAIEKQIEIKPEQPKPEKTKQKNILEQPKQPTSNKFDYDTTIERIENFKDFLSEKDIPIAMINLYNEEKKGNIIETEMYNQFKPAYEVVRELFIKEYPREIYN